MNKHHKEILSRIVRLENKEKSSHGSNYSGSPHLFYGLNVPELRGVAKKWFSENKNITFEEFIDLLESLFKGKSKEEKKMAGNLIGLFKKYRSEIDPSLVVCWIDELEGWQEIDSLCQSVFTSEDFLGNWNVWKKNIKSLSESMKPSRKRASLVLLTGSVRQSGDNKFSDLAFENIDNLKSEKDILITKAVSWLLRELIKNHRDEVKKYLEHNGESLPKIAARETWNKLKKGKK